MKYMALFISIFIGGPCLFILMKDGPSEINGEAWLLAMILATLWYIISRLEQINETMKGK